MKKSVCAFSAITAIAVVLTGCLPAANPNNTGHTQGVRLMNNQGRTDYVSRPDIAQRIMETVPGISSAVVLVKNNTAYVAVNEGTIRRNGDTNRAGGTDYQMRGAVTGERRTGTGGTLTGQGSGTGGPTTSGAATGGGTGMTGGGTTGGGTTGSGPTGAGATGGGATGGGANAQSSLSNLPQDLKQRIDTAVRQTDNSITTVYASNSQVLMTRFNTFNDNRMAARSRAGINDLGDVIRYVFPTAK